MTNPACNDAAPRVHAFFRRVIAARPRIRGSYCAARLVALALSVFASYSCLAQIPAPAPPTAATPPAGVFQPAPTDEVVVAFPSGQTRPPVVTGPLWNGSQAPPPTASPTPPVPPRPVVRTRSVPKLQSPAASPKAPCAPMKSDTPAQKSNAGRCPPPRVPAPAPH